MPAPYFITVVQLARLVGKLDGPRILDLRTEAERTTDERFLPAATRRDHRSVASWADRYENHSAVTVCGRGSKIGHGVAASLRQVGIRA